MRRTRILMRNGSLIASTSENGKTYTFDREVEETSHVAEHVTVEVEILSPPLDEVTVPVTGRHGVVFGNAEVGEVKVQACEMIT